MQFKLNFFLFSLFFSGALFNNYLLRKEIEYLNLSNIQLQTNLDLINSKYSHLDTSFNLFKMSQMSNISNTSLSTNLVNLNITSLVVFLSFTFVAAGSGWFVGKFLYSSLLFKFPPIVLANSFWLKLCFNDLESTFKKHTIFSKINFTHHIDSTHLIKKIDSSKVFPLEEFLSKIVVESDASTIHTATDMIMPFIF